MPCGGIFPCPEPTTQNHHDGCWVCGKFGCRHFLEEWDTYIHARCAVGCLMDPDSDVHLVVSHGHEVVLDFNLERERP